MNKIGSSLKKLSTLLAICTFHTHIAHRGVCEMSDERVAGSSFIHILFPPRTIHADVYIQIAS